MGHYVTPGPSGNISVSNRPFNTVTGTFGGGNVAVITATQTFTFPATAFRVRLWGGGANGQNTGTNGGIAGGGGGFAMKTFTGQTAGSTVTATIGAASGTTSFGSLFSASGGHPTNGGAGIGINGDIIKTGSTGIGGGGASGSGGGAAGNILIPLGIGGVLNSSGMNGPFGKGGNFIANGSSNGDHGIDFSLDGYGCGGGGSGGSATIYGGNGNNGGGGGAGIVCGNGGFPGGAGGGPGTIVGGVGGNGAPGLIIVEW